MSVRPSRGPAPRPPVQSAPGLAPAAEAPARLRVGIVGAG
ncbi:oxidoreductase, partial [Modestobacter versicolor]